MGFLATLGRRIRNFLQRPLSALLVAGAFVLVAVLFDGTLFRVWSLDRDRGRLEARIEFLKGSIAEKERKIVEANQPEFIERQAREQLDFVRDGDLVFVFSGEATKE
ncbi:MAG: septum formation initiator family protein [Bdellovibrionales bacterium]|jgi:cell division protein FtsB|nr:septum formation initiator family protein [Bdellovibrionales bacterium]